MRLQKTGRAAPGGGPPPGAFPARRCAPGKENAAEGGSVPDVPGVGLQALLLGHLVLEREKQPHFLSFFPGGTVEENSALSGRSIGFPFGAPMISEDQRLMACQRSWEERDTGGLPRPFCGSACPKKRAGGLSGGRGGEGWPRPRRRGARLTPSHLRKPVRLRYRFRGGGPRGAYSALGDSSRFSSPPVPLRPGWGGFRGGKGAYAGGTGAARGLPRWGLPAVASRRRTPAPARRGGARRHEEQLCASSVSPR